MITRCVHPPDNRCVHPPDYPCESRGLPLVVSIHPFRPFDKRRGGSRREAPFVVSLSNHANGKGDPFDKLRANLLSEDKARSWSPTPVRGEPVEPCEREGARAYIEEGGDGFLLGGRNDGWGRRRARGRGYPEGGMGRGLPRAPGMDSCSRAGMTVGAGAPGPFVVSVSTHANGVQPRFPRRGGSRTAPTSHRPFMAPSTSSEPAPYLIRGRTGR